MPVRLVTDSACDLPDDLVRELGIEIVPLTVRFGDDEFLDRVELPVADFYEKMAASDALPETAAPSPGAFDQVFRRLGEEGADAILCVNLSSRLSATMSSAQNAVAGLDGQLDVRVVDSRSISSGLGSQLVVLGRAAKEGTPIDELEAMAAGLADRTHVVATLDTLENLKKGGRIGAAQAMLGGLLSIKPIIDVSTGVVEEAGKQRTRRKAMLWLRDHLASAGEVEHLWIAHGQAPDLEEFQSLIAEVHDPAATSVTTIGATIGTHGGPRILGLTWHGSPVGPARD